MTGGSQRLCKTDPEMNNQSQDDRFTAQLQLLQAAPSHPQLSSSSRQARQVRLVAPVVAFNWTVTGTLAPFPSLLQSRLPRHRAGFTG